MHQVSLQSMIGFPQPELSFLYKRAIVVISIIAEMGAAAAEATETEAETEAVSEMEA